ncbi:MAG: UDP-N-acetylglucosamine 1-carboxyvinyltransferase, partial [Butyrivibrio sp.]|nr:UDP-N-acetylglucosamine 1-carboxyvinyltransferase [Butyrivibrio sp.]
MSTLVIRGQKPVSGTMRVAGNKNAALPMIAAALLAPDPVTLTNVPDIVDVASMLEAAKVIGAVVSRDLASGTVTLHTPRIRSARIDAGLASRIRTSFLFAGPLLA